MRKLAILILMALALMLPPVAGAQPKQASPADVAKTIEQGYAMLKDLRAAFTQRSSIAALNREQKSSGELFIKKPVSGAAMFRFNYTRPSQQIVSNGKTVWFYQPDNKQVIVAEMAGALDSGGLALSYLTGMGRISGDFNIGFAGSGRDGKGNYQLELVPKKPGQAVAKIVLTVAAAAIDAYLRDGEVREPFPILGSVLVDSQGNRTTFEFSRPKVNQGLAASLFTMKIPAGVEVIHQGAHTK